MWEKGMGEPSPLPSKPIKEKKNGWRDGRKRWYCPEKSYYATRKGGRREKAFREEKKNLGRPRPATTTSENFLSLKRGQTLLR